MGRPFLLRQGLGLQLLCMRRFDVYCLRFEVYCLTFDLAGSMILRKGQAL